MFSPALLLYSRSWSSSHSRHRTTLLVANSAFAVGVALSIFSLVRVGCHAVSGAFTRLWSSSLQSFFYCCVVIQFCGGTTISKRCPPKSNQGLDLQMMQSTEVVLHLWHVTPSHPSLIIDPGVITPKSETASFSIQAEASIITHLAANQHVHYNNIYKRPQKEWNS